ncbi:hypothetical protein ACFQ80_07025 [Isoptericola sp. NPDC056578]|uniref:hypothetical protein n=1 Tax=Isoptericola sp. NPDC056578 TaxID=3345870 RepID=UPI0036AB59EC
MSAIVLTWNPQRWALAEGERTGQQARTESGRLTLMEWSVGRRRSVPSGQRAFLLRQGAGPRGIVASGWTRGLLKGAVGEDASTDKTRYVQVDWDFVVDEGDPLPVALLAEATADVNWNRIRQRGVDIPDTAAAAVESLWSAHVRAAAPRHLRYLSRWRRRGERRRAGARASVSTGKD